MSTWMDDFDRKETRRLTRAVEEAVRRAVPYADDRQLIVVINYASGGGAKVFGDDIYEQKCDCYRGRR